MFFTNANQFGSQTSKRRAFIALLSLLSVVWSFSVLSAGKKGHGARATPVVVSEAAEQFLAPTIKVPGTVLSRQQSELPAEVEGRLTWVADVGTKLKVGEVVARLDDTLYKLKAAENKATLQREMVQLKYLEKEVVRLEALIKGDFSSKNTLDKMFLDRDVARSEVVVAKAKIKLDEATLRRYKVYAPFNGIVVERTKREGEWISGGDTVITISNPDNLEIDTRVSDKSINYLNRGDTLNIYRKGKKITGTVRAIVRIGDVQSHLFDIKIDMPNQGWLAGQVVKVEVPIGQARKVMAVPRDALVLRQNGSSIFRISVENKAEKVSITTNIASGELIGVEGNIKTGDKIVIRGGERLRPGQTVKILPGKSNSGGNSPGKSISESTPGNKSGKQG